MKLATSVLVLLLAAAVSTIAQNRSSYLGQADPAATGSPTQLSGCLQGTPSAYRLMADSGNPHLLIGDEQALSSHVGDRVTLQGYRDDNRDASASSDEGTPHGMRFFQVQSVTADQGKCNRR
ncbi:MAG TPA: hypothetical protein VMD98_11375 [Bryocella sp.]|nr:hypothetical protein [Bryocella sp.]